MAAGTLVQAITVTFSFDLKSSVTYDGQMHSSPSCLQVVAASSDTGPSVIKVWTHRTKVYVVLCLLTLC